LGSGERYNISYLVRDEAGKVSWSKSMVHLVEQNKSVNFPPDRQRFKACFRIEIIDGH